jgi:hypothetical protein
MISSKNLGLTVLAVVLMAGMVIAATPQTIVIDGINDFLLDNLVDADGGDTQYTEIDIDSVFVTNDTNKIFFGVGHNEGSWTSVQMGIHISTGDPGGTSDSWGRAIAWTNAPHKPDYQAYVNLDNNWQELRNWNDGTTTWDVIYGGTGSLGWATSTGFRELALSLSDLGLAVGDTIYYEVIVTQDGSTKGPLDLMAGDADQLSTPTSTTWDVAQPVELTTMAMYIVQASGDAVPPTVESLGTDGLTGTSAGAIVRDYVTVRFSEPVDETTAETTTNYALSGTTASISSAVRNPSQPDRVRLNLDSTFDPQNNFVSVTVTGVEDLAGNPIVDNGTTNVGCFFFKGVLFRGLMGFHLAQHTYAPDPDTFSVEGSLSPLTFGMCDNALMTDVGGDTYETYVGFSVKGEGCGGTPSADTTLEWKFQHQCMEYEPLASNRVHVLSSANGAWDTLEYWWNDEDATDFTIRPIDVIFIVDVNSMSPGPDSVVAINGSELPLTFNVPSDNPMTDDGVYPDETADDGIYSIAVRFPTMTYKNVGYKFLYNGVYECQLQGDRGLWLNDAEFDTIGGTLGPIVMPLLYYDRCGTIGRDVEVIFRVATLNVGPTDTVAVNGEPNNQAPPVIGWEVPSINPMHDDGVYPDETADDGIYATSIVFPDSTNIYREYKYIINSTYECLTQGNRIFYIDDSYDAVGNPQVLDLAYFNSCWVDVSDETPAIPFALKQNYPNPFNPVTTISFTVPERGRAVLSIFNVKGELVRTLVDRTVEAGEVSVSWDGTDRFGRQLSSGVYFYNLKVGELTMSRKMVLLR